MKTRFSQLLIGISSVAGTLPALAQYNQTETRNGPISTNVYAWQQIELQPGCVITPATTAATSRFEAKIKPLEAVGGRWSEPVVWTPQQADASVDRKYTGMVGIHTHVLPNGLVLSWEGHNDDLPPNVVPGHLSHAYAWIPSSSTYLGGAYNNAYLHYDNEVSNTFCSGHAFLADGQLLVAGGHYSAGGVDRGAVHSPYPINTAYTINNPQHLDFVPLGVWSRSMG